MKSKSLFIIIIIFIFGYIIFYNEPSRLNIKKERKVVKSLKFDISDNLIDFRSKFIKFVSKIPTFLISLDKDEERRNELYKHIIPKSFYAVNGKNIDKKDLIKNGILKNDKLTLGEIGCYLSHFTTLLSNMNNKSKYILILEDDVTGNFEANEEILQKLIENVPDHVDYIALGYNHFEIKNDEIINIGKTILKPIKLLHGTQSYLFRTNSFNKIINLLPITEPYDLASSKIFNSYIIEPKIFDLSKYGSISNTQGIR
jgi:GR25 family glycosyltransferase involved in LPS biosynthesis